MTKQRIHQYKWLNQQQRVRLLSVKAERSVKESMLKRSHHGIIKVKIIESVTMGKAGRHDGISICGFSVSIYELPKHYEAQFIYKDPNDMDARIERSIDYLGEEGFFKPHKKIKATAIHLSNSYPSDNPSDE